MASASRTAARCSPAPGTTRTSTSAGGRAGRASRYASGTPPTGGDSWINATPQPDGTWAWQRVNADGTVHSQGTRAYRDFAKGRWSDTIAGQEVRWRRGGAVREFDYTVAEVPRTAGPPRPQYDQPQYDQPRHDQPRHDQPVVRLPGSGIPSLHEASPPVTDRPRTTLAQLLEDSARNFRQDPRPSVTVTVNREVWKEFDLGMVFRERKLIDAETRRFREINHQWGMWRDYRNGRLVEQRTITGRVWATDPFGRRQTAEALKLPEYFSLPPVGGEVGLDGHRSWRLIGREAPYRGYASEFRSTWRNWIDVWSVEWTGVRDGESVSMPMWLRQMRAQPLTFLNGFTLGFASSLMASAAEYHGHLSLKAVEKALFNGAVGGVLTGGVALAHDLTKLQKIKIGMANLDWAPSMNSSLIGQTYDWEGDLATRLYPRRWRSATYEFINALLIGELTAFVTGAADAAIFGINGTDLTGLQALKAGAWGAAGGAFAGVTTGLAQRAWHFVEAGRLYSRAGLGDMVWTAAERTLSSVLGYWEESPKAADIPYATTAPTAPAPSHLTADSLSGPPVAKPALPGGRGGGGGDSRDDMVNEGDQGVAAGIAVASVKGADADVRGEGEGGADLLGRVRLVTVE